MRIKQKYAVFRLTESKYGHEIQFEEENLSAHTSSFGRVIKANQVCPCFVKIKFFF